MSEAIKNRYEFLYIFDVQDGNPNGDPDSGNLPRVDPETMEGLVTDVCLKRKIRNYVQILKQKPDGSFEKGFDIFVKEGAILNEEINESHEDEKNPYLKEIKDKVAACKKWLSEKYWDIRAFGGVLNTGKGAGNITGPVQMSFARSIERIFRAEYSMTVVAGRENHEQTGLGPRKSNVPYGLYIAKGFVSAHLAQKTIFTDKDLDLLWEALEKMFDQDRAAARGEMAARKLIVFKHVAKPNVEEKEKNAMLGNAPAHKLFEMVKVYRVGEGGELLDPDNKEQAKEIDKLPPARKFIDYKVLFNGEKEERKPMDKFEKILDGVEMQVRI